MAEVKTIRLKIVSLTNEDLENLINRYKKILPDLSAAYQQMLDECIENPENAIWYTAWKICLSGSMTEIGYAGFRGVVDGHVEIGYGIDDEFQRRGYATEAVKALCNWALNMPGIFAVEAETLQDNIASKKVLINIGFEKTGYCGDEGPRFILKKCK